ncbi:hypothetical protein ACDP95_01270 [Weissella confusa]
MSDEIARVEARHFLVFLYALGIFSNTEECLCLTDDLIQQQNRLIEMVLDEVQMLGDIKFSQLQSVRLGSYLEPKLIQLSVKYGVESSEYGKATIAERFPDIDVIVGRIIARF